MLPTILLLPGSFTPSVFYFSVQSSLWKYGYSAFHVPIPSVIETRSTTTNLTTATMADDAAYVQTYLKDLVENQNKEVVIVTHSYSGLVGTEAVKGFSKKEREERGLIGKGGVTKIIHVASLVPAVGKSAGSMNTTGLDKFVTSEGDGSVLGIDASAGAPLLFNDLAPGEGLLWAENMVRHSAAAFTGNLTFPAWQYVEVAYVMPLDDLIVPLTTQQEAIDMMNADPKSKGKEVSVYKKFSGHMAPATHPDWVVSVVRRVVGEDA